MKIKHLLKIYAVFLMTILLLASCEWVKVIDPEEVELPDEISFSTDIQPVFSGKCIACHSSRSPVLVEGQAYNSLVSGNYVNTSDAPSSVIVIKTNTGHGALSPSQKALLLGWIEQGAKNN